MDKIILDGELSLVTYQDGEAESVIKEGIPPVIEPLTAEANGTYTTPEGVDGYSPVKVDVPPAVIEPLTATENGVYTVPEGMDGYSPVTVAIPEYDGAYTVEPSTEEQTLATSGKVMTQDIAINKAFGIIKFYAAKKVETNAKYNEFGDFKKAQLPDLPTDRDIVMIDFVNNTSNNRAGVYWIQVKSPQKSEVVTGGKRVGGQFGGSYGCDVYAGATINVYVGDYQL